MTNLLNHSPADIVAAMLVDLGYGDDPDTSWSSWPIFAGVLPNEPDNAIMVKDTASVGGGREMVEGDSILHRGIQVTVRASDWLTAYQKANAVMVAFDREVNQTDVSMGSSAYRISAITVTSDVLDAGLEEGATGLRLTTVNAITALRQLAGTGT